MKKDVLIIGSGVAGMSLAIRLAEQRPDISILVLSKVSPMDSNTAYAQGGIAAVMSSNGDSYDAHKHDTLKSGGKCCNVKNVETLVHDAPGRVRDLVDWGARFDTNSDGNFHLGLEGGHSIPRIIHSKDQTGREVLSTLLLKASDFPNIELRTDVFVLDLETDHSDHAQPGHCSGAWIADMLTGECRFLPAGIVVLATGGSGQVYAHTTNPACATGDGIVLACRAGATVSNMHYTQFHPTALYEEHRNTLFLLSEALRGYGAHLVNRNGDRFLFSYDARGELATRDIVSQAIFEEMHETGACCVYLDMLHLPREEFEDSFPNIAAYLNNSGYDINKNFIPVIPAAHYQCGGIDVDESGRSSVRGLYALGECANNGVQGANRLASNSLSEGLVFARYAADSILMELNQTHVPIAEKDVCLDISVKSDRHIQAARTELQLIMMQTAGNHVIMPHLQHALEEIRRLLHENECRPASIARYEFRNMCLTALSIVRQKAYAQFELQMA